MNHQGPGADPRHGRLRLSGMAAAALVVLVLSACEPQPAAPVIDAESGDVLVPGFGAGQADASGAAGRETAAPIEAPEPRSQALRSVEGAGQGGQGGALTEIELQPAGTDESVIERSPQQEPDAVVEETGQGPGPFGLATGPDDGRRLVALLLPLTDPNPGREAMARAMENATRLAMEDLGADAPRLAVYDTVGREGSAADAARRAIGDGAELMLGPLTSGNAREIRPALSNGGVNAISFSTDAGAAGNGVYLIGSLPSAEFRRILRFAAVERGYRTLGAILPRGAYGAAAKQALERVAAETGSELSTITTYDASFDSAREAALNFADLHLTRFGPGGGRVAVLVPDSGSLLATIAAFLAQRELLDGELQLLGTGVWDSEATLREDALRDGWFVVPDPRRRNEFSERYARRFGTAPPLLAGFAYDAGVMAGTLVRVGGEDPFSRNSITNPAGFLGTAGAFRFTRGGLNERSLAVLRVEEGGFRIIEPAPQEFPAW